MPSWTNRNFIFKLKLTRIWLPYLVLWYPSLGYLLPKLRPKFSVSQAPLPPYSEGFFCAGGSATCFSYLVLVHSILPIIPLQVQQEVKRLRLVTWRGRPHEQTKWGWSREVPASACKGGGAREQGSLGRWLGLCMEVDFHCLLPDGAGRHQSTKWVRFPIMREQTLLLKWGVTLLNLPRNNWECHMLFDGGSMFTLFLWLSTTKALCNTHDTAIKLLGWGTYPNMVWPWIWTWHCKTTTVTKQSKSVKLLRYGEEMECASGAQAVHFTYKLQLMC
jgi:hypothetical protein